MTAETKHQELQNDLLNGRITRREFVFKALTLGVSLSSISAFLAACSGSTEPAKTAAPQAQPTQAAAAPKPGATSAPVQAAPTGEQKLIIGGSKDIRNLDPNQDNDADSTYVYSLIHDSIASLEKDLTVKPRLAESWTVSPDGLTYTYKFRKGVKFHDGSQMTAEDVVYSIGRYLENKYPEGRKKEKIEMIDSIKKVDDYTVEVKLKYAYAPFDAAFGVMMVLPKAAVEKIGDAEFTKKPVGCGPFKFVEWIPNDHVTLVAFDDYWMVKPKLKTIVVRPLPENAVATANLISGDVDMINDIVGPNVKQVQAAGSRGVKILSTPGSSYFWAGFRMLTPPFTDIRFRQAVYLATDFDAAMKAVFPVEVGSRAYGSVPPGLWPRDDEYLKGIAPKQDQAKARALFKQLVDEGVMPKDYVIPVGPPNDDARIKISEIMITNLKECGVNAEIPRIDWSAYSKYVGDETNKIFMLGTIPAIPDPDANIRWLFSKDSVHGVYLNLVKHAKYPEWDAAIKKAQSSSDRKEREQIYRDLQRAMMENFFHIPLYFKNAVMGSHEYVKGFDVNPQFQWDIVKPWANVYIEGKK